PSAGAHAHDRGYASDRLPSGSIIDASVETVTPHHADAGLDGVAVATREAARADHRPLLRQRKRGGHPRRLRAAQPGGRVIEITLRPRFHTISADAGFGDVEIDFHDPPLVPDVLDQHREPGFQPFAEIATALPQEHVLGGLLADGRAAANPAALGIPADRVLD